MARPLWKGSISFGLVNIPISIYPAEKKSDLHFKLLDKRTKSEIRYEKVNAETGEEAPLDQIVKGYRRPGGDYVLLSDEDFRKAAVEASQTIEILDFVSLSSIAYIFFEKPYYVVPEKRGEKGYVLLREVLRRTGKVAVAKVVIRARQHLSALAPEGDALVLSILRFHDELRDRSEFSLPPADFDRYKISEKELQIAEMLVESMTREWDPAQYHDEYREALMEWIEKKAQAEGAVPPLEGEGQKKAGAGKVVDMMELLKKSVQLAKDRGRTSRPALSPKEEEKAGGRRKSAGEKRKDAA
jgi:DNA end-binding protein Ku